ncbi:RNA-binding (RRM/RBD/RNP motifs) family protein [Actinidia rufa]|uniref:RNA-binding (RRM/RBD/RNP motifs) family protein n=1 Tax=Actinidia rufa TaxID=165716 RepID=A0A7J0D9E9_9ERIC|nr:RNA-binding (RRM/RBD/RNP motifs) family protein [Actinidia rufa]
MLLLLPHQYERNSRRCTVHPSSTGDRRSRACGPRRRWRAEPPGTVAAPPSEAVVAAGNTMAAAAGTGIVAAVAVDLASSMAVAVGTGNGSAGGRRSVAGPCLSLVASLLRTCVRKEEIRVEVEDSRYLIIRTEAMGGESAEPGRRFSRKFQLPAMVDVHGIVAGYENVVLRVTVPRSFVRRGVYIEPSDLPERLQVMARAA